MSEHALLRSFLQRLGSTYVYMEAPVEDRVYMPVGRVQVKQVRTPTVATAPTIIVKRKYSRIFSYYGGKSKIAHLYPAPRYDTVIEPFAGGASYSVLHYERQIVLNEKDPITASVWRFLLRPDAMEYVERHLPTEVKEGGMVFDLFDEQVDNGLINLVRGEISQGALGETGYRTIITKWGARDWHQVKPRLEYWIPKIKYWTLLSLDYSAVENRDATWYVDPPYNNSAGSSYRTNDVDYEHLGRWCVERNGQVIVCENEGATWLPFRYLTKRAGSFSGRDEQANASGGEVIWEKGVDSDNVAEIRPVSSALSFAFLGRTEELQEEKKPAEKPATPASSPQSPSALGFALLGRHDVAPEAPAPMAPAAPKAPPRPAQAPLAAPSALALPAPVGDPVADLAAALRAKGHRLLTRDGKLFISESSFLTDADRALIKEHKPALFAYAEPWIEARPTSLATFLGNPAPAYNPTWIAEEPPDLTGIDEVILNFATDGLDWHKGARPVGVTVSTLDGQLTRFLPFRFAGGNLEEETIKRWAREQLRGKKITNSKTKFDLHQSREWGVDLEEQGCTFSDIQHTAALLDDHRKRFGLDVLAQDYFPGDPFVGRVDESRHHHYHAAEVAEREIFTARLVGRLRDVMYPEIDKQELRKVQDLEDAVIPATVEMEKNGSLLNVELLDQYHKECLTKHDQLLWEVAKECGFAFDHTAKGWQRLFEVLGLPPTDGNDEAVINGIDHPLVKKGYLASQYASLDSKTFKAYKDNIGDDGVLRFEINQLKGEKGGTVSGRFSIGYVHQVPNHDNHSLVFGEELFPRRLFIPETGDYLEADAMQIEQRLLVHYMKNPKLIAQYDGDLERLMKGEETVSYHKITWKMLKDGYKPDMLYSHTKNYNFAFQYGAKSIKLAVMMKFITEAEGDEIRRSKRWNDPRLAVTKEIEEAYRAMMPEGGKVLDRAAHLAKTQCDEFCKRNDDLHRQFPHRGYVKTYLGRRSRFPMNYKTYIGLNRVLQGTAADIMKQKIVELHRERKRTGFVMRLTVHDAVGGDAKTPETKAMVSEILNRQSFPLSVPILWSTKTGPNWAEVK